jgi:cysteine-rich repeat protein
MSNDNPALWCSGITQFGAGDFGTPGMPNDSCVNTTCGDGFVQYWEECDDEDKVDGDGCDTNCKKSPDSDFDGIPDGLDNCPLVANKDQIDTDDDGKGDACDPPECGNLQIEGTEECDDGNTDDGDGCSSFCKTESFNEGDIIITEIMYNPAAVGDGEGEWFEIYNVTDKPVNINGWVIKDDGKDKHVIKNAGGLVINSKSHAVLGILSDTQKNGGVQLAYQYKSTSLGNTNDSIILLWNNVIIDKVVYDSGISFPAANGQSLNLSLSAYSSQKNDAPENWCLSTQVMQDNDKGTPGKENDECQPPEPVCQNSIKETGEECDDGNDIPGDGCEPDCKISADQDDDGIYDSVDNCPLIKNENQEDADEDGIGDACDASDCGNSVPETGEECDDGNEKDGDGCSSECKTEDFSKGDIIITEIMYDPEGDPVSGYEVNESSGEYFEVFNTTNHDIDMNGWIIEDKQEKKHVINSASSHLFVKTGAYAVFANSADSEVNGGFAPDYKYSFITLNNDGDAISLIWNGTVIDIVEYDYGFNFPKASGKSLSLAASAYDDILNDSSSAWCLSGLTKLESGDYGTPGLKNDKCPCDPNPCSDAPFDFCDSDHLTLVKYPETGTCKVVSGKETCEYVPEMIDCTLINSDYLCINSECVPKFIDDCKLKFPSQVTLKISQKSDYIFGHLWKKGITDATDKNDFSDMFLAQVGFGIHGTDPSAGGWQWFDAESNTEYDKNSPGYVDSYDEFMGKIHVLAGTADTYDIAFRFSIDSGQSWKYCDLNGGIYSTADAGSLVLEDPCAGKNCESPPLDTCADSDTKKTYKTPGICAPSGISPDYYECKYTAIESDCISPSEICYDGKCADNGCDPVNPCTSPSPDYCEDIFKAVHYSSTGTCTPDPSKIPDYSCDYSSAEEECTIDEGFECIGGTCVLSADDSNWNFEDWLILKNPPEDFTKTKTDKFSVTEEKNIVNTGTSSAKLEWSTTGDPDLTEIWKIPAQNGTEYTIHAWLYDNDPNGYGKPGILFYDSNNSYISSSYASSGSADSPVFREMIKTASSSNAGLAFILGRFKVYDEPEWQGNAVIYIDDWAVTLHTGFNINDGILDSWTGTKPSSPYLVFTPSGLHMKIHASLNDQGMLYVATGKVIYGGSDNFLFVWISGPSDSSNVDAMTAEWGKSGSVPSPVSGGSLFVLAQEQTNSYCEWRKYDPVNNNWGGASSQPLNKDCSGNNGSILEGTLDLVSLLGPGSASELPAKFGFAAGPYSDDSGKNLLYEYQSPESKDSDGDIDFNEVLIIHRAQILVGNVK